MNKYALQWHLPLVFCWHLTSGESIDICAIDLYIQQYPDIEVWTTGKEMAGQSDSSFVQTS